MVATTNTPPNLSKTSSFEEQLSVLQKHGCMALVTGETPNHTHPGVCDVLFGAEESAGNTEFYVKTTGGCTSAPEDASLDESPDPSGPAVGSDPTDLHILEFKTNTRSVATENTCNAARSVTTSTATTLPELEESADKYFDSLEPTSNFAPQELRVCVDDLYPVLDAHPTERVVHILRRIGIETKCRAGFGHAHLPVAKSEVEYLKPIFDIVISIRSGSSVGVEQQWEIVETGTTSGWL